MITSTRPCRRRLAAGSKEAAEQGLVRHLGFTSHAQADQIICWPRGGA